MKRYRITCSADRDDYLDLDVHGTIRFFPDSNSFRRTFSGSAGFDGTFPSTTDSFSMQTFSGSLVCDSVATYAGFKAKAAFYDSGTEEDDDVRIVRKMELHSIDEETGKERFAFCRIQQVSDLQRYGNTLVCRITFVLQSPWLEYHENVFYDAPSVIETTRSFTFQVADGTTEIPTPFGLQIRGALKACTVTQGDRKIEFDNLMATGSAHVSALSIGMFANAYYLDKFTQVDPAVGQLQSIPLLDPSNIVQNRGYDQNAYGLLTFDGTDNVSQIAIRSRATTIGISVSFASTSVGIMSTVKAFYHGQWTTED